MLPDLESFVPDEVLVAGRRPQWRRPPEVPAWVRNTVRVDGLTESAFALPDVRRRRARDRAGAGADPDAGSLHEPAASDGLAKLAVLERHLGTGRVGLGLVRGFELQRGAIASSVAHDAHNLIVAGVDDSDMLLAVQRLAELGGGMVSVEAGEVLAELPLPIAGLLSDAPVADVLRQTEALIAAARWLGCELEGGPFHPLSFLALSVIPALKLTDQGLVDVDRSRIVPLGV